MKLFLASSLSFVSDVVIQHFPLEGKNIGCIWNGAKQRGGKEARWNQRDLNFFIRNGASITDIDIESHTPTSIKSILENIDAIFVGGGDTVFLAKLMRESGIGETTASYVKEGLVYMGTSAGAMIASHETHDAEEGARTEGLGLVNFNIIPHRNQPGHKDYWLGQMDDIYSFPGPTILLNDIDVIIVEGDTHKIVRSKVHTLDEVFRKAKEAEDNGV